MLETWQTDLLGGAFPRLALLLGLLLGVFLGVLVGLRRSDLYVLVLHPGSVHLGNALLLLPSVDTTKFGLTAFFAALRARRSSLVSLRSSDMVAMRRGKVGIGDEEGSETKIFALHRSSTAGPIMPLFGWGF